uniref:(northern house mosquito) hypothetical protein n=1 Tax=Culex pipiens TaxID=7175 RepID=A0A8D8BM06_CULPI
MPQGNDSPTSGSQLYCAKGSHHSAASNVASPPRIHQNSVDTILHRLHKSPRPAFLVAQRPNPNPRHKTSLRPYRTVRVPDDDRRPQQTTPAQHHHLPEPDQRQPGRNDRPHRPIPPRRTAAVPTNRPNPDPQNHLLPERPRHDLPARSHRAPVLARAGTRSGPFHLGAGQRGREHAVRELERGRNPQLDAAGAAPQRARRGPEALQGAADLEHCVQGWRRA